MKKIKKLVDEICEELEGAKEYAEMRVDRKANGDNAWAQRFEEMANDELKHANYIHEYAVSEINKLREVYTPPQDMIDKWEQSHKEYVEKAAWIKQMLAM